MDVHEELRRVCVSCEGTWLVLTAVVMGVGPLDLSLWFPNARGGTGSVGQKYYSVCRHKLCITVYAPAIEAYRDAAGSRLGGGLFRSWDDSPMLKTSNTEGTDSRSMECSLITLARSPSRLCDDNPDNKR